MSGLDHAIAVVSDRSLVADAVSTALVGSDVTVVRVPWPGDGQDHRAGWAKESPRPPLGLMLCDLSPPAVHTARWLVGAYPTRWLLLTDSPRGPLWGAMIEVGVIGILKSATSLSELLAEIGGSCGVADADRLPPDSDDLVAQWHRLEPERSELHARLSSLTPRELEVLRLLHLGRSVREIAQLHGVAHSTVRSQVRSILHKLGVSRQVAAAAVLDEWGGLPEW
ncbi:response regulator transcription factor [Nocardioides sp. cx-169]|uniref:response regulator transcription factor n=1 Tax=Nocardioides sp. cx-169 TaxID=2899080 RepID=UPI001E5BFAC2|nr:response regulator transcription factor [Nocardioides sp. cx-169]MCD4536327.1 response regulator transcription factor [Nocardioides sp. cx-169]